MKKIFRFIYVVSILLSACGKEPSPSPAICSAADYSDHPRHAFLTERVREFREKNHAPGCIVAVRSGSEPAWIGAEGMADLETASPMYTCTPFRTGSITKVFMAVLVLQLAEQQKLGLDDKLQQLLPETQGRIPDADKITLRQLLNHTSGIIDPKNDNSAYQLAIVNNPDHIGSMDISARLEKYVYGRKLKFSPGSSAYYSNAGYWLIGKILERASQQSLQTLFENQISIPLGLGSTYYEKRNDKDLARGYAYTGGKLTDVTAWDRADGDGDPSSGVISNAPDLLRFGEALFGGELISAASLAEMCDIVKLPSCPDGNCEYGLGLETWTTEKYQGFGKNGSSSGVDANWICFPSENCFIIIFVNRGDGNDKSFTDLLPA